MKMIKDNTEGVIISHTSPTKNKVERNEMPLSKLFPVYPNEIGEGISKAHVQAIEELMRSGYY